MYVWLAKVGGPSIKLFASNVHTMDELRFTGNALKGSRPILSFDPGFDTAPELQLVKELLQQIFSTPLMHPKSKPFIDHMLAFYWLDGRVWLRHFQIAAEHAPELGRKAEEAALVEIGPRAVFQPVKILAGAFEGATLWENPKFVAPSQIRAMMRRSKSGKYIERVMAADERRDRRESYRPEKDKLDDLFLEEGEEGSGEEDSQASDSFED